jgi:hypothetical protein
MRTASPAASDRPQLAGFRHGSQLAYPGGPADAGRGPAREAGGLRTVTCPQRRLLDAGVVPGRHSARATRLIRIAAKPRRAAIRALLARASQQLYLRRHRRIGGVFAFEQT